jgi:hypothetical protein
MIVETGFTTVKVHFNLQCIITIVKLFIAQATGINVIKLFVATIYECLL